MTEQPVKIHWTETALAQLRDLPKQAAKGLVRKVSDLREADPKIAGKPLVGPLAGCYRVRYGRYRAVYQVEETKDKDGQIILRLTVVVLLVGKREDRSRRDVYELAKKLIGLAGED